SLSTLSAGFVSSVVWVLPDDSTTPSDPRSARSAVAVAVHLEAQPLFPQLQAGPPLPPPAPALHSSDPPIRSPLNGFRVLRHQTAGGLAALHSELVLTPTPAPFVSRRPRLGRIRSI